LQISSTCRLKAARLKDKTKGKSAEKTVSVKGKRKQAQKAGSRKNKPPSTTEESANEIDETWRDEPPWLEEYPNETGEDRNEETLLCVFTVISIWFTILITYAASSRKRQ
jgi:hypothetical protein